MLKKQKNLKIDKSLIILLTLFLVLFFLKAMMYSLIGNNILAFMEKTLSFIPENILFYTLLPIIYIFMSPMIWILDNIPFFNPANNMFITFLFDITLTILYLTILFFLFKKTYYCFKRTKKN